MKSLCVCIQEFRRAEGTRTMRDEVRVKGEGGGEWNKGEGEES